MENTNIKVFSNESFGNVRAIEKDGEPWFVGKDVCEVFKDKNHNRSLSRIDEEDKTLIEIIDSRGRKQKAIFVNESGLYALLFAMQPQKAHNNGMSNEYPIEIRERIELLRKFKHWVTNDVIPSIRKHGAYMTDEAIEKMLSNPDYMIELLTAFKSEKEARIKAEEKSERMGKQVELLEEQNGQLTALNSVLASENIEWSDFSIINAMVRKYAMMHKRGNMGFGWNDFCKEIMYKCGINLKSRHTRWCAKNPNGQIAVYKLLKEDEIPNAIKVFASMCNEKGVDVGDIIASHRKETQSA